MIKTNKIPYGVSIFAVCLPWIAAFFDKKLITYLPLFFALFFYLIYLLKNNFSQARISFKFLSILSVVLISASWQLINKIGIGSGGTIIIIVLSYIFYQFFTYNDQSISVKNLFRQLVKIYLIQIIFIYFELFFRLAGGTGIIVSLVGSAENVMIYKMYNKAVFLRYLGFSDMTGLGGMLLGSQSASQVALFSVILFAPFYNSNLLYKINRKSFIWFVISIVAFFFCITMTSSILMVIFTILLFFFIPNSKLKKIKYQTSIFIIVGVFLIPISQLIFFNINNQKDYLTYFNSFYASIEFYLKLDLIEKFFRGGRYISESMSSMMITNGSISDFGIGMLLNQSGIFLIGIAGFSLIHIFFKIQKIVKTSLENLKNHKSLGLSRHYK